MKQIVTAMLAALALSAAEYYAKQEPIASYVVTSKVAGLVTFVNTAKEGKLCTDDEPVVRIDDEIARVAYEAQKETFEIRKDIYERTKNITTKSKAEKDTEKISFLVAQQNYTQARDNYFARILRAKGLYVGDILVKKNGYVSPGTPLFRAYDYSASKLTIFVDRETVENIQSKKILVDGRDDFKLAKFYSVADETYVSSYKVELVGPAPKLFSKILKVEIK